MKKIKNILCLCLLSVALFGITSCGESGTASCSHTYGAWTISKAATCEEDGQKAKTCTKCGDVQTEKIAAKGHNYSNGVCTVCGKQQ